MRVPPLPSDDGSPHERLWVWRRAMELGWEAYRLAHRLPAEERYELGRQIRRAAASIPANIAEGNGRRTPGEIVRFLNVAHGSLTELRTHVRFAGGLAYLTPEELASFDARSREVGRLLTALVRSLERRRRT